MGAVRSLGHVSHHGLELSCPNHKRNALINKGFGMCPLSYSAVRGHFDCV